MTKLTLPKNRTAAEVLNPQTDDLPPKVEGERSGAIQPEGRDIGPASGSGNQAKLDRMSAIADAVDEGRIADGVDIDKGDPAAEAAEHEAIQAAIKKEADDQILADAAVLAAPEKEAPTKVKLTVNGREIELTQEELIARAQKVESADAYLQAAKEATRIALKAEPSKQDVPAEKSKDIRALARAIQMGTEDEAEQALRQLIEQPPSKTPDVAVLVDQRMSLRDEKAKFDTEYADVLSDPNLRSLVMSHDESLVASEPELSYPQRWRKAGDAVREWKKGLAPTANSMEDKAARKAAVAPVPSAAGRQAPKTDTEPPDDPGSVISEMAARRGQGRAIQH